MGSYSDSEVFFDLKNFFGLDTCSEGMEAERMDVNEVAPHLPTIPADLEAETPGNKQNNFDAYCFDEKKSCKTFDGLFTFYVKFFDKSN